MTSQQDNTNRQARGFLAPALLALVLVLAACSSPGDGDESAVSSDDESGQGDNSGDASGSGGAQGVACGPLQLNEQQIAGASGRLTDAASLSFQNAGLSIGAPEQWSLVSQTEAEIAIADPDPLSDGGSSYWVRIVVNGVIAFDGVCDFGLSSGPASPDGPTSCSVVADGFALTTIWEGADPAAPVAILRDGEEIHLFAPTAMATDSSDLLNARRAEHGEPVVQADENDLDIDEVTGDDSSDGDLTTDGGFADLTATPGETHAYSVQAVGSDGSRSDPIDCGQGTLDASGVEVTCSVEVDEVGWPVVRWQTTGAVQIVVNRDGSALEPDAVTFSSPHTDRSAPAGQQLTYSLTIPGSDPIDCGQVNIDEQPTGSVDLQAAATDNANNYQGPFQYVTLQPVCETCQDETVELYLVPDPGSPAQHVVETVWVDGVEEPFPGPWLIDPLVVAGLLLEADENGQETAYSIDPATGIIDQWTIAGEGAVLVCLEVDTRPIDMRDDRCGRSNLLN